MEGPGNLIECKTSYMVCGIYTLYIYISYIVNCMEYSRRKGTGTPCKFIRKGSGAHLSMRALDCKAEMPKQDEMFGSVPLKARAATKDYCRYIWALLRPD